jgi:hypothetical protein
MPDNETFVATLPSNTICELDEDRLLATGPGPAGHISEDAGRTWGESFPYMQDGAPIDAQPMTGGVLRLNTGELGMVYRKEVDAGAAGYDTIAWYFARSGDEGKSWGPSYQIDMPAPSDPSKMIGAQHMWGNLLQLSSGRLISSAYWSMKGLHKGFPPLVDYPVSGIIRGERVGRLADGHTYESGMGACYVYYSDDLGETWTRCTGSMKVWPIPGEGNIGGSGGTYEPVVIELKDGRVLLLMRTKMGRFFQSFSSDGGDTWTLPEATTLSTGDVPCWLGRLRSTGDILVIWNQSSAKEIERGYSRGRLSVAVSKDEVNSWQRFRTVAQSDGLEDAGEVELAPVKHVRAKEDLGVLPDDFSRYDYPRLAFVHGKVVMIYKAIEFVKGERVTEQRATVVPESWFYE